MAAVPKAFNLLHFPQFSYHFLKEGVRLEVVTASSCLYIVRKCSRCAGCTVHSACMFSLILNSLKRKTVEDMGSESHFIHSFVGCVY